MSATLEVTKIADVNEVHHVDHDDHHEQSFWRTYVFSTDHKIIGILSLVLFLKLFWETVWLQGEL